MSNKGTIGTAITLPVELWNEMEKLRADMEIGRSRFVQSALRKHINKVKQTNVLDYLEDLDDKSLDILKKEIKKRG